MKILFTLLATVVMSGCVIKIPIKNMPSNSEIIEMSSDQIACDKAKIVVVHRQNNPLTDNRNWDLKCGAKNYVCKMENDTSALCKEK